MTDPGQLQYRTLDGQTVHLPGHPIWEPGPDMDPADLATLWIRLAIALDKTTAAMVRRYPAAYRIATGAGRITPPPDETEPA